jgi:hypothetical protein
MGRLTAWLDRLEARREVARGLCTHCGAPMPNGPVAIAEGGLSRYCSQECSDADWGERQW